ncbi:MAG: glycosyltransferase family 4 protein [Burkholderiales bacterium]|nr:glycosyltransferase family 4 protein [Burkholderiales bacterium]
MDASIALIGPLPPPSGGMANQTQQLRVLLAAEGLSVEVVQTNAPYRPAWVVNMRGVRAVFRLAPYLARLWSSAGRVDLFHVMANSGWAWHLFAAPAVWVAKLRRVPVVVNYRGGAAAEFLERSAAAVRFTMRLADRLVVPSGFLVDVFARYGMQAEVVPNVVDLGRFAPGGSRPDAGDAAGHIIVTRNLEAIYDVATALRAFRLILDRRPMARMTVAGSGPERAALEQLAVESGVAARVVFSGRLDNEQIARLYREADVLLNPSRVDNFPISILEALASAVPVVSTDVGGIPHLVRQRETALLVPAGDAVAMASAILEILGDRGLGERMSASGRALAEQYAWSAVRPKLLSLYRDLLSGAASPTAAAAK